MGDLQAQVTEWSQELGVPGIAVGVDLGGDLTIATAGVTSVDHGRPIDETTLFQIGSTAKTFTATAIMALADQGVVTLDAVVRDYLPELRLHDEHTAQTVTVRHLLNHTAGWDGGDAWIDTGEGDDAVQRAATQLVDHPQQFPAGAGASYNNAAYVLAGRLIEEMTGETYDTALARLVLEPLGLQQTLTSLNMIMSRSFAVGHTNSPSSDSRLEMCSPWSDPRGYLPAGARLASSLHDQLRWARFQLGGGRIPEGGRLLSEHSWRTMHEPSTEHELMPGVRVGLGWLLREIQSERVIEHHGDVSGQHSSLTILPSRDCAIVVLTNATPQGRELAERVTREVMEDRLALTEQPPTTRQLGPDELAPYAGHYRTDGIELRIVVAGAGLIIHGTISDGEPAENLEFPIGLLDDDHYLIVSGPFAGMRGEFVRQDDVIVAARHIGRLVPRV